MLTAATPTSPGATLVVDTTYQCNARCRYCRWGDGLTKTREHHRLEDLCVPRNLQESARIGRVVFSGGEPLVYPHLGAVLSHYRKTAVPQRIVITNGLLATPERLVQTHEAGATGFAFSIDATDDATALVTRGMRAKEQARVMENLEAAGRYARLHGLELTVNCVLSSANCSVQTARELARVAAIHGASSIKFQPVFDDGYLGSHAPELRLDRRDAAEVRAIGLDVQSWAIAANPPHFFEAVAAQCEGQHLLPTSCDLGGNTYVLQGGALVICPWMEGPRVSSAHGVAAALRQFEEVRPSCQTGPHCFCMQPRDQRWGGP